MEHSDPVKSDALKRKAEELDNKIMSISNTINKDISEAIKQDIKANINLLNENEPFISKAESSEKILVEENDDKIVESNLFRGGKQQE